MTRVLLIIVLLPLCWLWMMIVHEAGHTLGAWLTGGEVTAVVLHPLEISQTDVVPNPRPLIVAWMGPLFGALAPLGAWLVARAARVRAEHVARFFAGFCLVANGTYIGSGPLMRAGDAADMLRYGSQAWMLYAFGAVASVAGLATWHRLGPRFGFGPQARSISSNEVLGLAALLGATVVAEVLLARAF